MEGEEALGDAEYPQDDQAAPGEEPSELTSRLMQALAGPAGAPPRQENADLPAAAPAPAPDGNEAFAPPDGEEVFMDANEAEMEARGGEAFKGAAPVWSYVPNRKCVECGDRDSDSMEGNCVCLDCSAVLCGRCSRRRDAERPRTKAQPEKKKRGFVALQPPPTVDVDKRGQEVCGLQDV